jgi:hypothetical protein
MSNDLADDRPIDLCGPDFVRRVMDDVREMPARCLPTIGPLWGIWSLARTLVLAGAAVLAIIVATRAWETGQSQHAPATVAESLGVPPGLLPRADHTGDAR